MTLKIIDASNWQNNNVADYDVDGFIFKATEGRGYVDPTCDPKYQRAKARGKLLGVYHFARPDLGNSAEAEAEYFCANTKGYWEKKEAVLALDWEAGNLWDVAWAKRWLDKVAEITGVKPLIYMSASVVTKYDWSSVAKTYGLWIAGYPNKYNVVNPPTPTPADMPYKIGAWDFWAIWQYSSSKGTLDLNIAQMDATAWGKYAGKTEVIQNPAPSQPAEGDNTQTEQKPNTDTQNKPSDSPVEAPEDEKTNTQPSDDETPQETLPEQPNSTDKGLSVETWNEILGRSEKTLELVDGLAKQYGVKITMPDKLYDILKFVATVALPALGALYAGLASIWGFPFGAEIDRTVLLVIACLDTLLGITVAKASSDYKKTN